MSEALSSDPSSPASDPDNQADESLGLEAPPRRIDERLPLGRLLAYGPPMLGVGAGFFLVQFYFLKFATDVLLIAPAAVGLIMGAGRIWDAISDPIAGYWSDRTRSRLGRRRPWMLVGSPLLALTFLLVWIPPASLTGGALLAWVTVSLFAFYSAFTIYSVPHQSLGAELTSAHHERSRIFGLRHIAWIVGMMFTFVAMQAVNNADDPRSTAQTIATLGAVAMCGLLLIPPIFLRERADFQGRGGNRPYDAFRDIGRNPHARILLTVWFIESLGIGVLGLLSPYLMQYVMKRPDMIAAAPAFFVVASVASVPLWVWVSRHIGKRNVWITGMLGTGLSFGSIWFLDPGDDVLLYTVLIGAGFFSGCGGAVGQSILADVIDWDELASGERKEGAYSAAWGFAVKLATGTMIVITGVTLQLAGFAPNREQSETTVLVLQSIYAGMPFTAYMIGAFLFRRFRLDAREHARILSELEARRTGVAT